MAEPTTARLYGAVRCSQSQRSVARVDFLFHTGTGAQVAFRTFSRPCAGRLSRSPQHRRRIGQGVRDREMGPYGGHRRVRGSKRPSFLTLPFVHRVAERFSRSGARQTTESEEGGRARGCAAWDWPRVPRHPSQPSGTTRGGRARACDAMDGSDDARSVGRAVPV